MAEAKRQRVAAGDVGVEAVGGNRARRRGHLGEMPAHQRAPRNDDVGGALAPARRFAAVFAVVVPNADLAALEGNRVALHCRRNPHVPHNAGARVQPHAPGCRSRRRSAACGELPMRVAQQVDGEAESLAGETAESARPAAACVCRASALAPPPRALRSPADRPASTENMLLPRWSAMADGARTGAARRGDGGQRNMRRGGGVREARRAHGQRRIGQQVDAVDGVIRQRLGGCAGECEASGRP